MIGRFRSFFLLLCLGVTASAAHATTIIVTLDPNWPDYHQYSYTDTNGSPQSATTGPYSGTFTGGSFGTAAVFLFCYDFNVETFIGQPYSGSLVYPTSETEIEAAYLMDQVLQAGGYNADVQSSSGPAAMAIWFLENPSSVDPTPFPVDQTTAALVAQAQDAYLNGTWTASMAAAYPIWIPDIPTSSQRFGVMLGPSFSHSDIAPEPGSAWLFGIGSLLLFLSGKFTRTRFRRRSGPRA
jgi:hypothetical protein